jgi:branched-chain amino acid transport system substrate-binding protein
MSTTASFRVVRAGLGAAGDGIYSGTRYVPSIGTGDNRAFVEAYGERFDRDAPDNFSRVAFDSVRMTAQGIQAAGTADPVDVKDELAGMDVDSLFGPNRFRACDHQATNPVWVGRLQVPDGASVAEVNLEQRIAGPDAVPDCSETGCSL